MLYSPLWVLRLTVSNLLKKGGKGILQQVSRILRYSPEVSCSKCGILLPSPLLGASSEVVLSQTGSGSAWVFLLQFASVQIVSKQCLEIPEQPSLVSVNRKKYCLLCRDHFGVSHLQLIHYLQGFIYKRSGSGHFTTRELKTSSGWHKLRQVLRVSTVRWSIWSLWISTGNVKYLQNETSSNRNKSLCP